jgi:tripartite-type tricarboxylate transporter receptor subunit TctC
MRINRRRFLQLTAAGLAVAAAPLGAAAAAAIPSLRIIEPLGKPSVIWTTSNALVPGLGRVLQCPVALETVLGDDGYNAIRAALKPVAGEVRLWGGAIMATQYVGATTNRDVKIDALMPVAKLSDGFSVCLFAKQGSAPQSWSDVTAATHDKPLKVSCLQRTTAAYVASLMLARKGGIAMDIVLRDTIGEVQADVVEGRASAGIIPTVLVRKQAAHLQPLVTFGAQRYAFLPDTPTFAELVGNPKLAFTESVGVLAPAGTAPDVAAALSAAFLSAAGDPDVVDDVEARDFPVIVSGAEVLRQTMERNRHVLERILA